MSADEGADLRMDVEGLQRELAALKARRCDGCVWAKPLDASSLWVRGGDDMRRCDVVGAHNDFLPLGGPWCAVGEHRCFDLRLHACNAWMAKEPTT